jgi:hypothetical protein
MARPKAIMKKTKLMPNTSLDAPPFPPKLPMLPKLATANLLADLINKQRCHTRCTMYQRSGQLKPKTLNLDPLRRKTKTTETTTETAIGAAAKQARKQANKQASKQSSRDALLRGRRDQNRDQKQGGTKTGIKTRGETTVDFLNRGKVESAFFFQENNY